VANVSHPDELLTSTQAGTILGKSARTILRMAEAGELTIAHTLPGPNGHKLFRRSDVEALAQQQTA
jgi:hypothetical protein